MRFRPYRPAIFRDHPGNVRRGPRYCDVIVRRWQEATGASATLEATDQDLAAVAVERGIEEAADEEPAPTPSSSS